MPSLQSVLVTQKLAGDCGVFVSQVYTFAILTFGILLKDKLYHNNYLNEQDMKEGTQIISSFRNRTSTSNELAFCA